MKNFFILILLFLFIQNLSAQDKNVSGSNSSGKIWGYAFGDYFYKAGGDSSGAIVDYAKYKKDYNAFEFRRVYLGYDYSISEKFATSFVAAYEGEITSDGKRTVFVKDANLKWKDIFHNSDLTIGLMPTSGYSYISEKIWGYRPIEKTILDLRGILSSRDLGVMLNGTFDKDKNYGYYLMIGNGTGVRLENNKYKRIYGTLYTNLLNKKILIDIYGDYEPYGNKKSKTTLKAFAGFQSDIISLGAEAFEQIQNNFNSSTIANSMDIIPLGISFFANGKITKNKLKFFARYDYYNPDTKISNTGFYEHFVSAGLDYMPHEKIHIMPNIWLNAYSKKNANSSGRKSDVVPRITFFYEYR